MNKVIKLLLETKRLLPSFFLFSLIAFAVCSCDHSSLEMVAVQGRTMGTTYNVKVVGNKSDLPSSETLSAWADLTFQNINQSMSTYISDSELSVLNSSTSSQWQPISEDLYYVLSLSRKVSELSGGAFDVTVAPLVNLWGFGPQAQQEKIPQQSQIDAIKANIGFHQIVLSSESKSLKKPAGVTMDLSAVAKGFAADAFAKVLMDKGFHNIMVEVGGELTLLGMNNHSKPWTIGIETPSYELLSEKRSAVTPVTLSNKGMATSGDYRNYFEEDGVRYSHTIDPTTGRPITHTLASVTVIADECAEADALATALNVLGSEKALALAEKNNLAVYLIVRGEKGFDVRYSTAFKAFLGKD